MSPTVRRIAFPLLLLAAAFAVASVPAADAAAGKKCRARAGTVYKDGATRYWHERRGLYACTTLNRAGKPRTVRLGPWTSGGKLKADGPFVMWTTVRNVDGTKVDRVWAATADGPSTRWLAGVPAVPASGDQGFQEGQVAQMLVNGEGGAWITTTSDVVLTVGTTPDTVTPIGTPPIALRPDGNALLIGSFPATPPAQLAASGRLSADTDEADDCGGVMHHSLTVTPGGAEPVGATWYHAVPADPVICNL